jgi:hypothetical protein
MRKVSVKTYLPGEMQGGWIGKLQPAVSGKQQKEASKQPSPPAPQPPKPER